MTVADLIRALREIVLEKPEAADWPVAYNDIGCGQVVTQVSINEDEGNRRGDRMTSLGTLASKTYMGVDAIPPQYQQLPASLTYGPHARQAARDEGLDWHLFPSTLPVGYKVVELVECFGQPIKYGIRFPWIGGRDLVLMVRPGGYVITCWTQPPSLGYKGGWKRRQ